MDTIGMAPSAVDPSSPYAMQMDYDINNNPIYVGRARIGSPTSGALWQIKKLNYDVNKNLVSVVWANGNDSYVNVWDNRAALSYS